MKKFAAVGIIFFSLIIFFVFEFYPKKSYRVLEVVEGDKLYIDLNRNLKKDKDELFHIENINTFPLKYTEKAKVYAERYDLEPYSVITLGYIARELSKTLLEGKNVTFRHPLPTYNPDYYYRFASIELENKDYAQILLENGLAIAYDSRVFNPYVTCENPKKIKKLAKKYSKIEIFAIDKKYKIYHVPICPKALKIKEYGLVQQNNIPKDFKKCPHCLLKNPEKQGSYALNSYNASLYKTFSNISIFLINPNSYNKPSFLCRTKACRAIIDNIKSSKSSIDFALYGIDGQNEVISALNEAKKRGVKIRGVVDSKADSTYVYADTKKLVSNFSARPDLKNFLMHNKFFVFDGERVLTGTMNVSTTGSGGYNANTVVFINDKRIAQLYRREFERLYNKSAQNPHPGKAHNPPQYASQARAQNPPLNNSQNPPQYASQARAQDFDTDYSAVNIRLNPETSVSVFFSPNGKAYEKGISPLLKNARKKIFVSIFYLTHKGIIEDLISAKKRGVDVKIIYDALGAANMKKKVQYMRGSGVLLKAENWGGKNHEKNMVIDGKYFITGSANFSYSGMNKNDENILIFDSPKIAKFYEEYFINLYNSIDNKYLKYTPRSESFESINSCYDGIDNNFDGKKDSLDQGCIR